MKRILFSANFFETDTGGNSHARFEAGKHYPADDAEALRCVARGIAAEVDVEDEPAPAPAPESESAAAAEPAAAPAEPPAAAPAPAGKAKK